MRRRLLFVRTRTGRKPRLYLTVAALIALGAISAEGIFRSSELAGWQVRPLDRPPPPKKASDGGQPIPPQSPKPGNQSRWM